MTINGTNITTFGARLHRVNFAYGDMSNESEWIRSAVLPHLTGTVSTWKRITVELFVYGEGRDEIHSRVSSLYAALLSPADIVFDNIAHYFKMVLVNHSEEEFTPKKKHKVTLELQGYEYGDTVTVSGGSSISVTNPGSAESPLRLSITPSATATNVKLTGVCRNKRTGEDMPVTLQTMTSGTVIVLDGANGLFTEGTALKGDILIKAVPALKPGTTVISSDNSNVALSATVLPIYL